MKPLVAPLDRELEALALCTLVPAAIALALCFAADGGTALLPYFFGDAVVGFVIAYRQGRGKSLPYEDELPTSARMESPGGTLLRALISQCWLLVPAVVAFVVPGWAWVSVLAGGFLLGSGVNLVISLTRTRKKERAARGVFMLGVPPARTWVRPNQDQRGNYLVPVAAVGNEPR
jgi:hypothetical protein